MSKNENSDLRLRNLAGHVQSMNRIFECLIKSMEGQVEAIVSSDPNSIEKMTEEYSSLSVEYKGAERDFISELKNLFKIKSDKPLRLRDLKEVYPDASEQIDMWRDLLISNTKKMQQKHEHVVRLLEFALLRNSTMMRGIYSNQNSKTSHYTLKGNKENNTSSLAVNQKI